MVASGIELFFNSSTRQWDRALLHSVSTASTRDAVLGIKLGNSGGRDKLCWMETKHRNFTVKSAYQVAVRMAKPPGGEHSLASQDRKLWIKLWALNTPPKVRNFVSQVCSDDILPTRANLLRRKIQVDPICTFCGQHDETTVHILWECPLARNVWALVRGKLQKCSADASNFYLLVRHLVDRLDSKELETWAMLSWALWNARNRYHFESLHSHPTAILQGATSLLDDYQRLSVRLPNR
uniref:Reverse transcriptase zinc-binding domain-containing protein n=2 Tax=Quercus lobata TaxID=97700 RepID=A0A7N2N2W0_QUELO